MPNNKHKLIKIILSIFLPLIISVALIFISSILIVNTNIPESIESALMIIISALCSIIMTVMLVMFFDIKGIFCSLISFVIMLSVKLLLTVIINNQITFSGEGIVSLAFMFLFCFVGGLIGSNIKK